LPEVGYFSLIAVWISRLSVPVAYLLRGVGRGDGGDSCCNVQTLGPENEKTAAGSNFRPGSSSDPSRSQLSATAKPLVGVERREVQGTDKKLL